MAKDKQDAAPLIKKPEVLKSLNQLNDIQTAELYGISRGFVKDNTKFINDVVNIVQDAVSRNDTTIASSTPQMIVDTVQASVADKAKKNTKTNQDTVKYLTDIKGLTDQSQDMDLFRELVPIATPMFELFYEYDMVYSMIPEASKCFDILKDAVLSADNFTTNYLIPRYDKFRIDSNISGINSVAQQNVNLIKTIVEEYELNSFINSCVSDAMKYGAKPVMVIPIDQNFRKSAERILKTESADELRKIIKSEYSDGVEVHMENYIEGFMTNESEEVVSVEDMNSYTREFDDNIDEMITIYEDALDINNAIFDTSDFTEEEVKSFEVSCENKKKIVKRAKNKKNRKVIMKEMATEIDKMVNKNIKFSYGTEALVMRDTSKVANQIKTMRKVNARNSGSKGHSLAMESIYSSEPISLENDVDVVCELMSRTRYSKIQNKDKDGNVTSESWSMNLPDALSFEEAISVKKAHKNPDDVADGTNLKSTGSVIIPLQPDSVIPISVHGKHIGYYVIERAGSDDLGSGVSSLLGYRTNRKSSSMGASNLYGANTVDSAGVIVRDMVDIPMYNQNDNRRIELLKNMLTRAISERISNPDIVDDKAFNSIIYSLIKDDYITNREVKITYVPAHSMVYFAHEIDQNTGIGISVMERGLFFAHVYIASLVTNLMISIAKSADREQVNVEVGMNNRIEATVQKVMRSLQSKRASVDSIGNVDTIMRSLGTFTRTISLRQNGNALIELETIPGQQIDLDNSLMDKSLRSFINSFNVPHSALNFLEDTEYARSISLQNALFKSKAVSMQDGYQTCASKLCRILIRNKHPEKILTEYNIKRVSNNTNKLDESSSAGVNTAQELIDISRVFLDLPAPEGLNIQSLNDQLSNISTFADTFMDLIVPLDMAMDSDKSELVDHIKNIIKLGIFKKYLPGIPYDEFDQIAQSAKTSVDQATLKLKNPEEVGGADTGGGLGGSGGGFGDDSGGGGDEFGGDLGGDMGGGDLDNF